MPIFHSDLGRFGVRAEANLFHNNHKKKKKRKGTRKLRKPIPNPMASELFIILILLQESVNILQQQAITILGGISAAYFFCLLRQWHLFISKNKIINNNSQLCDHVRHHVNFSVVHRYFVSVCLRNCNNGIQVGIPYVEEFKGMRRKSMKNEWEMALTPKEHHQLASSHRPCLHKWVRTQSHGEDPLVDSHSDHLE